MNHRNKRHWLFAAILFIAVLSLLTFTTRSLRAARTTNRLATNRLATNRLATNKLAVEKLSTNALSSTRLEANMATADLLSTEDGRDVYSYLINCALPANLSIQASVNGASDTAPPSTLYTCTNGLCVFPGGIGLAEYWIDHRLDPKGQRWVSACMFARVNAHDTAEPISLRGPHDALTVTPDEATQFPIQEGAFYGNLFTGDQPIDWNACRGSGQAAGEFDGLVDRDCAEPDPADPTHTLCGFKYAGDCADYSPVLPSPFACKFYDADFGIFNDCHDTPGDGHWPSSPPNREVITVYVACSPDC
jgi:hypothetical protein